MRDWKGYKKGVNLGGWLSQCKHTYEHYDSFIKESDIETIKGWGLDHVRIPVDYNLFQDDEANYIDKGFEYLDKAIDWCGKYGLNMILDIHKTYGFSFDKGENETGFFDDEALQDRFVNMWGKLASKYGNIGDRVAFELLNEVTDRAYITTWNKIIRRTIEEIRKIAPKVVILVGSYWNNHVFAVKDLDAPYDENIVYNFHCYEPLIFTHQGAGWVDVMPPDFRMGFKNTYKEYKKVCSTMSANWAKDFFVPGSEDDVIDSIYFEEQFKFAIEAAEKYNVPLYCGEYGVIDLATKEDTLEWYKTINKIFTKYNIGRAAWSYKSMNFGLSEARLDAVRDELLKYM
ncbi:MAG: cellulase family glycosylhydrolase [Lachnospiraceae bacterium]|nr:cellulase family glycosylhydrolase [Lachnospiraceae bacterium]